MKLFGNKEEFAIGVSFYVEEHKDDGYIKENLEACWMGGQVWFWVKGKNLFEYMDSPLNPTYAWTTLKPLVEFFADYLIFHVSNDSFPVSSKATNAYDIVKETSLIKTDEHWKEEALSIDWDEIDMELRNKRDMWMCHHGFLQNRGGSFLPHLYIRKVKNKIEISWDNESPYETGDGKLYFLNKKGVEYIDINLYKNSVVQFCLEYIRHVGIKFPKIAAQYKEKLKKSVGVEL